MNKKLIYVDMDDVICNYTKAYEQSKQQYPDTMFPQSVTGFYLNLEPINDSLQVIRRLMAMDIFDVYILTAPSVRNPHCYTEKRLWIEKYFDMEMVEKLIISPNKGLNKGDYLIDDKLEGRGQEHFEGKLLQFGSDMYKDWNAIWEYFIRNY